MKYIYSSLPIKLFLISSFLLTLLGFYFGLKFSNNSNIAGVTIKNANESSAPETTKTAENSGGSLSTSENKPEVTKEVSENKLPLNNVPDQSPSSQSSSQPTSSPAPAATPTPSFSPCK